MKKDMRYMKLYEGVFDKNDDYSDDDEESRKKESFEEYKKRINLERPLKFGGKEKEREKKVFQVGDVVRCLDPKGKKLPETCVEFLMTFTKFKVTAVNDNLNIDIGAIKEGEPYFFSPNRFELLNGTAPTRKIGGKEGSEEVEKEPLESEDKTKENYGIFGRKFLKKMHTEKDIEPMRKSPPKKDVTESPVNIDMDDEGEVTVKDEEGHDYWWTKEKPEEKKKEEKKKKSTPLPSETSRW